MIPRSRAAEGGLEKSQSYLLSTVYAVRCTNCSTGPRPALKRVCYTCMNNNVLHEYSSLDDFQI
jgi:hypothetical protein